MSAPDQGEICGIKLHQIRLSLRVRDQKEWEYNVAPCFTCLYLLKLELQAASRRQPQNKLTQELEEKRRDCLGGCLSLL